MKRSTTLPENEEILNKLSEKGNFPITYLQGVSLSQKINRTTHLVLCYKIFIFLDWLLLPILLCSCYDVLPLTPGKIKS